MSEIGLKIVAEYQDKGSEKLKQVQSELSKTAIAANKLDSSLSKAAQNSGKSIFNLTEKLRDLQSAVFTEKDVSKIKTYNQAIASTEKEMLALRSAGTSSFGELGSGATKAFSSLRTIANILPGIGISGIVAFAAGPIIDYVSSLLNVSKALTDAQNNLNNLNDIYSDANKKAGESINSLNILYSATQNLTLSTEERTKAALELQKTYPATFGNFSTENILLGEAKTGYDELTKSILRTSLAKAAKDKLDDLESKKLDVEFQKQKIRNATDNESARVKAKNLGGSTGSSITGGGITAGTIISVEEQRLVITNRRNKALKEQETILESLASQEKFITDFVGAGNLVDAVIGDGKKGAGVKEKVAKVKDTIESTLAELRRDLDKFNTEEGIFNVDKSKERVSAFMSAIDKLVTKFKLDPKGDLITSLFDEAKFAQVGFIIDKQGIRQGVNLAKAMRLGFASQPPIELGVTAQPKLIGEGASILPRSQEGTGSIFNSADVETKKRVAYLNARGITTSFENGLKVGVSGLYFPELDELFKSVTARVESFSTSVSGIAAEAITSIFSGIAEGGNPFEVFFSVIASGLSSLGKALIAYGVQVGIIQKIFRNPLNPGNAVLAIGAGIALQAVGAILKAKLNNTKFATGGYVSGPGNGTSDSINASLSNGEYVVKASAVDKFGVGFLNAINNGILPQGSGSINVGSIPGGSTYIPNIVLKGSDLVVAFNRQTSRNSRQS